MTVGPTAWVSGSALAVLSILLGMSDAWHLSGAEHERKSPQFPAVMPVVQRGEEVEIPVGAVERIDGKPTVWVAEPDLHLFIATPVELGTLESSTQRVRSGLLPGQYVVVGSMLTGGANRAVEARVATR